MKRLLFTLLMTVSLAAEDLDWPAAQAVLAANCIDCHGTAKQKGGLRLDAPDLVRRGGKHGSVLPTANSDGELLRRVRLPGDDDKAMPPDGPRLTTAQIDALMLWLKANGPTSAQPLSPGGVAPGQTSSSPMLSPGGAAGSAAASPDPHAAAPTAPRPALPPDQWSALAGTLTPVPAAVRSALAADGIIATALDPAGRLLRIDLSHREQIPTSDTWATLARIADHIAWLDAHEVALTDADIARLASWPRLTRLHLEHTAITPAVALHLGKLTTLDYLNLAGTAVDDTVLARLTGLSALRQLILTDSKNTAAGSKRLRTALPDCVIIDGDDLPAPDTGDPATKRKKRKS